MKQTKRQLTNEATANVNLLEVTEGKLTGVTNPDKLIGSLVLPDSITEIGFRAFQNCTSLTSVTIPDGVPMIAVDAFHNCTSLTSVVIPNSVTTIANGAFLGCTSLKELIVNSENPVYCSEDNIIYTKDKKELVAAATGLTDVIIPDGVTKIGWGAFCGCISLKRVTIPKSVTYINSTAFAGCISITELTINSENPVYCSENNIIYTKDKNA